MGKSQKQVRVELEADSTECDDNLEEDAFLHFDFDEPFTDHSDLEDAKLRASRRKLKSKKLPNDWQDYDANDWQDYDVEDLDDEDPYG